MSKTFNKVKSILSEARQSRINGDIESIQELEKETLERYIKASDIEASKLDAEAAKEKDPIKKLQKITKASKRGLGAFKAHLRVNEDKDAREYDYEGEMVKNDLHVIMMHCERLSSMLEDDSNLPEWVQGKITLAKDYMQTVSDYMSAETREEK